MVKMSRLSLLTMRLAGLRVSLMAFALLVSFLQASAQTTTDYVLGPEDVISVTVLRHPEFSGEFLVPVTGGVQLPAVGELKLSGMSLGEVQRFVLRKLRDRLKNPEVSVVLKVPRMQRVFVLGEVKLPGVFDLKPRWGVAEALSTAGGLATGVQSRDVKLFIERRNGEKLEMPLDSVVGSGSKGAVLLQAGDVLRFDALDTFPVFVTGKVKLPGQVRLRTDGTGLLAAIAQAGGLADGAALNGVRIFRASGSQETVDLSGAFQVGLGAKTAPATFPTLGSGDIVLVPESLDQIAILGFVTKPGFYPMLTGRSYRLSDAVALANGADKRGRLSKVGLIRFENGKETQRIVDLGRFLRTGDANDNPVLWPGDLVYVPETNKIDLSLVLSGVSSTALLFNALRR